MHDTYRADPRTACTVPIYIQSSYTSHTIKWDSLTDLTLIHFMPIPCYISWMWVLHTNHCMNLVRIWIMRACYKHPVCKARGDLSWSTIKWGKSCNSYYRHDSVTELKLHGYLKWRSSNMVLLSPNQTYLLLRLQQKLSHRCFRWMQLIFVQNPSLPTNTNVCCSGLLWPDDVITITN